MRTNNESQDKSVVRLSTLVIICVAFIIVFASTKWHTARVHGNRGEFLMKSKEQGEVGLKSLDISEDMVHASADATSTYTGYGNMNSLSAGDVVIIRNIWGGKLMDNGDGTVLTVSSPYGNDATYWLWDVEASTTPSVPSNSFMFKSLRSGNYLKGNNNGEVFTGPITGSGDAASWYKEGSYVVGSQGSYTQVYSTIKNYKQGKCIISDSADDTSILLTLPCNVGNTRFVFEKIN